MWHGVDWASHIIATAGCVALVVPVVDMKVLDLLVFMLTFCMVHGVAIRIFVLTKRSLILSPMLLICLWILQCGFIVHYTYLHYGLPSVIPVALRYIFVGDQV